MDLQVFIWFFGLQSNTIVINSVPQTKEQTKLVVPAWASGSSFWSAPWSFWHEPILCLFFSRPTRWTELGNMCVYTKHTYTQICIPLSGHKQESTLISLNATQHHGIYSSFPFLLICDSFQWQRENWLLLSAIYLLIYSILACMEFQDC